MRQITFARDFVSYISVHANRRKYILYDYRYQHSTVYVWRRVVDFPQATMCCLMPSQALQCIGNRLEVRFTP